MTGQDQILELLQRQLAGDASLPESIAALAGSDPRLDQITGLLAQREEALRLQIEEQEQHEVIEQQEADQIAVRREHAQRLRQHLDALAGELDAARAILDDLAGALGACAGCFGTDQSCRWCRGRGVPGFVRPDPDGFERLVLPAMRVHARLRDRPTITSS